MRLLFASPPARPPRPATGPARTARSAALVLLLLLPSALAFASCSLKDIHREDCTSDEQCAQAFGAGSACVEGYCTDHSSTGDGGPDSDTDGSCTQKTPDGRPCNACPPKTQADFLNACTGAACEPFDNKKRLTKLTEDGGLPKLPPPPPDASGQ